MFKHLHSSSNQDMLVCGKCWEGQAQNANQASGALNADKLVNT